MGNKKTPLRAKKEMTLDCGDSPLQSRVISVHSYYLTSLVNLSFCGIDSVLSVLATSVCFVIFFVDQSGSVEGVLILDAAVVFAFCLVFVC